jgi:hypothetical protein
MPGHPAGKNGRKIPDLQWLRSVDAAGHEGGGRIIPDWLAKPP